MDEEIKKQSEIIKKTQELVKETKKLADAEKDRLKGKTNISGFSYIEKYKDSNGAISQREKNGSVNAKSILGLTDADFAADGSLLNEALIEKKLADRENAAQKEVDKYSDKDEDNASRIVAENALARVQAENDAIRAEMEQYKADAEAYWEHVEQEYEARMQKKALELSKIQYKLKLEIDISDDDINYLQHLLERAQKVIPINGMFGTTQNYQLGLLQQQQQEYGNKISSTKNAIIDILKQGGLTQAQAEKFLESGDLDIEKLGNVWATSFSEEQIEALREYKHNLLEFETEWENIDDIISHLVVDSMEQWLTEMDKVQAGLDAGLKTLEHYDNTISIVGKEFLGVFSSQTAALRWATVEQQQSIARGAKKTYEVAKEYQDKAIAIYEEAKAKADLGDLEAQASLSNLKKAADEATATVYERLSEWQGAVDAALQGARDAFEKIIEEYTKDVLKPFNDLQEARERNKQAQEGYLDTTTKYYELAKLTRDINKSIDESTNIKNKEALVRVLQKVNKVREDGAKLTQYESDYLRKEYELELARLQLAEAREAKSEVRIARDSEGNFSYVYTADQNKLDEATKNFEDKLQEAYELSRNYIESTQDLILSYQQEAAEKIQELYLMDLEDDEREKKEKEILEHYKGLIEEQSKNLELGLDNQKGLYENYYKELEKMGQSIALPQDFIDEWQEIDLTKTFDGIVKSAQDFADHFNKVIEDIAKKSKEEFLKYSEETAEILEDEGSLQKAIDEQGNLTITYNFDIDKVLSGAVEGENAITQFAEDSVKSLETLADSVTNWAEDAINNFNQVTDSIADITTALSNLNKELSLNDFWAENGDGMAVARVFANLYSEPNANGETEFYRINGKTAELNEQQVRLDLINRGIAQTTNQDMVLKAIEEALKKKGLNVSRFATGGYTGNWSGGGRLGILDQKELILNDKDTKNILDVVSMVRDISNKINLSAMMSQFEALTYARPGKVSSIGDEGVLEQYVNITLDAPNLVDKNSVLEAFDNVINLAAQYAYKRR